MHKLSEIERAHQSALALIYKHTHPHYKGRHNGCRCILLPRGLVALDDLTESDIADLLPRALAKEQARKAARAQRA